MATRNRVIAMLIGLCACMVVGGIFGRSAHADASAGEALFTEKKCAKCHGADGTGGKIGPNISHVASKKTADELKLWISDPKAIKPDTKMPKPRLTAKELEDLLDYIQQKFK